MKKFVIDIQLFLLASIVCLAFVGNGCAPAPQKTPQPVRRIESPQRLISTAPSITEILFDIGIGERIVGDSRFTTYPPETKEIEKIGGLYDGNWERIVELKPDLVLVLAKNEDFRLQCEKLGIESLSVEHGSMEGVLASYDLIGERFGQEVMQAAQARKIVLAEKLSTLRAKGESLPPVRVLICIDRERESGQLQNVYVAGTSPYFQDAIRWAGGINVAETTGLAFPCMSAEGILALNPDVIVDLMIGEVVRLAVSTSADEPEKKEDELIADWKTLGNTVNAVKTGRIFILTENYATIPGPRTPLLVEKLFEILHGEPIKQTSNDFGTSPTSESTIDKESNGSVKHDDKH
ncbi:MAG: helical backbone metal receptor [Planctomycetaceae bacterium]|jgi:iron complex transport system substrate-binding protein|nr:helical backbone metal receptor [Planctomycetaceae bacterium]